MSEPSSLQRKRSCVLAFLALMAGSNVFADSPGATQVVLPRGVSVDIPNGWIVSDAAQRAVAAEAASPTAGPTTIDLESISVARYYGGGGYTMATVEVHYYRHILDSQRQAHAVTPDEFAALDAKQKSIWTEEMSGRSSPITYWGGTAPLSTNGVTGFVSSFSHKSNTDSDGINVKVLWAPAAEGSFAIRVATPANAPGNIRALAYGILCSTKVFGVSNSAGRPCQSLPSDSRHGWRAFVDWILGFLVVVGVGLGPAALTRFVVVRRPLSQLWGMGISTGLLLIYLVWATETEISLGAAPYLIWFASAAIISAKFQRKPAPVRQ